MQPESIIAIIIAIIATMPGVYSIWRGRKMAEAETANKLFGMVQGLTDELHQEQERRREQGKRIIEMEENIRRLEKILEHYRDGVNRLIGQLMAVGHEPVWRPDEKIFNRKEGEK